MSQDYRPRNNNRRRSGGGRGRGGFRDGDQSESRLETKSASSTSKTPSFWSRMFGWMFTTTKAPAKPVASKESRREDRRSSSPTTASENKDNRPKREERTEMVFDVVTPKLYVGNLSFDAVESDLFDLFSKVGAVKNVEIATDRYTNRSKGFGFVEMESLDTAKLAAQKLDRTDFMARQIRVNGAKGDKRPESPRAAAPAAAEAPQAQPKV